MSKCSVDPTHPVIGQAGGPDYWDPKGLRELLCKQERHAPDRLTLELIGRLIMAVDRHRPLGSDGKHGELHTDTCGCDNCDHQTLHLPVSDWYENHLVIHNDTWRERLAGRIYRLANWVVGDYGAMRS